VLGGVFICYRREDSAGFARLIYDRLTHKLGHESVFFDVDNIPPGLDFVDILSERVGQCDALIAVIGKNWASSRYLDDQRRLDDPNDFVRIEIEAALARKIRVIPILVDGATMPRPDDLPDSLKKLTRRQGIEISHTRFDSDVERLTRALSLLEEELRQREAAEAERVAREERDKREAAEAVAKAEHARQLANAEAERAIEEQRAREIAIAERAAREEREAEEATKKAEQARRLAELEAARRAAEEQRAAETAEADRTKRTQVEPEKKTEAQQPRSEAVAAVSQALFEPANAVHEPSSGPGLSELSAKAVRPSGPNKVIVASIVGALAFLVVALLTTHFESSPNVPATTTARTAETSPPAPNPPSSAQAQHTRSENCFGETNCFTRVGPETRGTPPTSTAPNAHTPPQAQYAMGSNYRWGRAGVGMDYQKALYWFQLAADQGYSDAEFEVGWFYENGLSVGRDSDRARVWYQKAADQGNSDAQSALQRLQSQQNPPERTASASSPPVTASHEQSFVEEYRKAADRGDPAAQRNLGVLYENGWSVTKDIEQAGVWYQKAADQGDALARIALKRLQPQQNPSEQIGTISPALMATPAEQNQRGDRYFYGQGVEQNYVEAMEWYRKAADQGFADAQHNIGALYENGWGVAKDIDQAKVWYQRAADRGDAFAKGALERLQSQTNPSAQNALPNAPFAAAPQEQSLTPAEENQMGDRYYYGRGAEQNYLKAMEWYGKAAAHGLADAQFNVGWLYENGWGVAQDVELAQTWYQRAAGQGDREAKAALDRLQSRPNPPQQTAPSNQPSAPASQLQSLTPTEEKEEGDRYFYNRGVHQDYVKAMEWYRKAADQGLADGQYNVGVLYENGWGVTKDIDQAKVWYQKAADQGDGFARVRLQRIQSNLMNSLGAPLQPPSSNQPQAMTSCDNPPYCGFPLKQVAGSTHFASELDSANGGGCLDVPLPAPPDASKGNNVWSLRLAACAHAPAYGGSQRWFVFRGDAGNYVIHLQQVDSYCLDLPWGATLSGTRVQLFPCHGHINQQWLITMVGKLTAEIKPAANPGMCVQAEGEAANAPVLLRPCQGSIHQRWLFRSIAVWR
jgi:TPR repeat protein